MRLLTRKKSGGPTGHSRRVLYTVFLVGLLSIRTILVSNLTGCIQKNNKPPRLESASRLANLQIFSLFYTYERSTHKATKMLTYTQQDLKYDSIIPSEKLTLKNSQY